MGDRVGFLLGCPAALCSSGDRNRLGIIRVIVVQVSQQVRCVMGDTDQFGLVVWHIGSDEILK